MAKRTTLNISLPEPLREWVEKQVEKGGFGTSSEYVRHLIREARRAEMDDDSDLEALLLEGLESGKSHSLNARFWNDVRANVRARVGAEKRAPRTRRKSA